MSRHNTESKHSHVDVDLGEEYSLKERILEFHQFTKHTQPHRDYYRFKYYIKTKLFNSDQVENSNKPTEETLLAFFKSSLNSDKPHIDSTLDDSHLPTNLRKSQVTVNLEKSFLSDSEHSDFAFNLQNSNSTFNSEAFHSLSTSFDSTTIVDRQITMAARPAFTNADPGLEDLPPETILFLNTQLTDRLNAAAVVVPHTRVTTVNTRLDVPIYNPDTMSSESFFSKCEKYFQAQGYPANQYHNMVHTILKNNVKLWYDSIVTRINSWDEFKQAFADRFDKPSDRERRIKLLYTRKQKSESCEQYIQEMVTLSRQIHDGEDEVVSVNRAFQGLHPELIVTLGCLDNLTLNSLMEKLAFAYDAIRARDARNKSSTWLPPLYGYNIEKGPQLQASGYRGRTDPRGQGRGTGFRPRLQSSFPQGQGHNNNNNFRSNNPQAQVNQSFGNYQPRFQYQQQMPTPQNFQPSYGNSQQQNSQPRFQNNRGFSNQTRENPQNNSQNSQILCRICKQYGHYARFCPRQGTINMAVTDGYQNQQPPQPQDYPANNTENSQQQSNGYDEQT
ncbi:unnamed protein product, partial [Orchesella dallaii]